MFDYEKLVFDKFFEHKRIWIKKATGLGITEFFIYFMLWLALVRPPKLQEWLTGSNMVIVTGPREETAKEIIKRAKAKLERAGLQNPDEAKDTEIIISDIRIKAYPSFNASWRGLDKISVILMDEADFFRESEQEEARAVAERYIGKSRAWIAMVSTPGKPGGLFDRIEHEDPCLYYRLPLDYRYGEGKIYTAEDIAEAKKSPQFGREYGGQYLGLVGTCFSPNKVDGCLEKYYDPEQIAPYSLRAIGIDPGWGSSAFGVSVVEHTNNELRVLHAKEYIRPDFVEMLTEIYNLFRQYDAAKIVIDGSAADFVQSIKGKVGDRTDYLQQKHEYTTQGRNWEKAAEIKVLPVNFGRQNKSLLTHCKNLIDNGYVAINKEQFHKLEVALRTASEDQGVLDKEKTSYHDILDSFMLSLWYFQLT